MKRFLIVALCVMALALPAVALAEAAPLSMDDVNELIHDDHETVQDYVDDFAPTEYNWYYEGDATGTTVFTLGVPGGGISIAVYEAVNYRDEEEGFIGATELKGDVFQKQAELVGAYWEGPEFDKLPLPRGLKLGDTKQQLQATIGELVYSSLEPGEFEENYDETASYTLTLKAPDSDWQWYYAFDFFLNEAKIAQVQMQYYTDAE